MRCAPAVLIPMLILSACGPSPKTEQAKAPEAPAEPVTGLHALYQMFAASHAWAPDAQVYTVTSMRLGDVKPVPGKAPGWQVTFVSPSLQQSRTYTYSVVEASMSLHKGIDQGKAMSWQDRHGSTRPFLIAAAKIDSDEAYNVALKKAADYSAKNPGMAITYQLEQTSSYDNAAWRVIWGESAASSALSVLVDASTGKYVETLH